MNFNQEDEEDIELPFTEEELKEKFDGKLEKEMKGPTYKVENLIVFSLCAQCSM